MDDAAGGASTATTIIGRYALYGEIASGGMATVHFGRLLGPIGFSRPVAIKRLRPQLARDESARRMFVDEARLVARIHHPNVVQMLDVVENGEDLMLVMEYVHGEALGKLARVMRKKRELIPRPVAIAIAVNFLHGLHAAHEATGEGNTPLKIVHRDVSPQNVMVGGDGVARVLDFGIARAAVRLETTKDGIVKGKLAYMAPEQLEGDSVTRAADICAAGIVLWEMLAGQRLLFRGEDNDAVMVEKLLRGVFDPPSRHAPGISTALDAVVMHALEREPSDRYATAREMALVLEEVCEIATASQVGAWVESVAGESLAERSAKLSELERCSSQLRAATPAKEPSEGRTPTSRARPGDTTGTGSRDPALPVTMPPVSSIEPGRSRSTFVVAAFLTVAFAMGGAGFLSGPRAQGLVAPPVPASIGAQLVPPPALPKACSPGMQQIPGGHFFMGSDDDLDIEKPAHEVTVAPYCIDTFEVTTASYRACSDRGECKRAGTINDWEGISRQDRKAYDPLCNARDPVGRKDHPVNCVDWDMATTYCKAQGGRLPTEAEWEFAARGPDGRKFPWGDEPPNGSLLNACGKECLAWGKHNHVDLQGMYDSDDGFASTAPVGSFPKGASRYGVQDVVGNVWEWVADFYAPYSKGEQVDPTGPSSGEEHVIRGGAWNGAYPDWVRPTFRYKDLAEKRSYGVGFRCAKTL